MKKITTSLFLISLLTLAACSQAPEAPKSPVSASPKAENTTASQTITPAENTTASQTITPAPSSTTEVTNAPDAPTDATATEAKPTSNLLVNENFGFTLTLPTTWNQDLMLTSDEQIALEDGFEGYGIELLAPKLSPNSSLPEYETLGKIILATPEKVAIGTKSDNKDYYGFLNNKLGSSAKYQFFFENRNLKTFNDQFPIYQFTAKDFKLNQ